MWRNVKNIQTDSGKWKIFKIWVFILITLFVIWWVRAGLIKTGVIPNWLWWIEVFCSEKEEKIEDFIIDNEDIDNWIWLQENHTIDTIKNTKQKTNKEKVDAQMDKPILYLYPIHETKVNIILWIPENLSHIYPKYNSEKWRNVIAQPNGDLEDIET